MTVLRLLPTPCRLRMSCERSCTLCQHQTHDMQVILHFTLQYAKLPGAWRRGHCSHIAWG